MQAKCKVCHRALKTADAIAAGIGPVCEQKLAASAAMSGAQGRAAREAIAQRLTRIERGTAKLIALLDECYAYRRWAFRCGTAAEQQEAEREIGIVVRALRRVERIRVRTTASQHATAA